MTEGPEDIISLETIPKDSKISITIDTNMYLRIQKLLMEGLSYKDVAHFNSCLKQAMEMKVTDPLAEHVLTLLVLCNLVEESAKSSNIIKKTLYDIKNSKIVDDQPPA